MRSNTGSALTTVLLAVVASGCVNIPKRNPLPQSLAVEAYPVGIPNARNWGDAPPRGAEEWFAASKEALQTEYGALFGVPHIYLAISGGGANGAYGAGLLVGWTAAGDRPEFSIVTGVSTGALMAPFAFLGPEHDETLRAMYTTITTKDLVKKRNLYNKFFSDGATSTEPFKQLLAKYVDESIVQAIAAEHRRGRRLHIATTNLDAGRPVSWNIGEIADSGHPSAVELIRKIMLASASLPAAFPPVLFDVEAEGQQYDELHVDGGATAQVFLYPVGVDWDRVLDHLEVPGRPKIYIIRNSRLEPLWKTVNNRVIPITGRTISSMIRTQGIGDLFRIYLAAERDGLDFHLASIPMDFQATKTEQFDPVYMGKLFDLGYRLAESGYPWDKNMPQLKHTSDNSE